MHILTSNTKLGTLVATAATLTLAFGLIAPDGWMLWTAPEPPAIASTSLEPILNADTAQLATVALAAAKAQPTQAGDERFWLGRTNTNFPAPLMQGVAIGDRVTIGGKTGPIRVLEVIDIKPLPSGLIPTVPAGPQALGTATPLLSLVTAKVVGTEGLVTRIIIEDAGATPTTPSSPANKAL